MKGVFFFSILFFLNSCSTRSPTKEKVVETERVKYTSEDTSVDVVVLDKSVFHRQIMSNGKLSAKRKSDLHFSTSMQIKKTFVRNGEAVRKGEIIASLNQSEFNLQLRQAQNGYKKARIELEDMLIGQGYDLGDSIGIPTSVFETAIILSGYSGAQLAVDEARYRLEETLLRSPFDGLVVNIKQKEYEQVDPSEPFCTVIDITSFEVTFQLTESEIATVSLGDSVKIYPISREGGYGGIITELNPIIDEFGLVQLKAAIENTGQLLEGMNVKVIVEKRVPDQLVVPKSAVVLRENQEVVFKVVNGKSYWTYVKTNLENSTSFVVSANEEKGASLEVGDTVIISGNLNLAHESLIAIK